MGRGDACADDVDDADFLGVCGLVVRAFVGRDERVSLLFVEKSPLNCVRTKNINSLYINENELKKRQA